jgi:hypothetical protein
MGLAEFSEFSMRPILIWDSRFAIKGHFILIFKIKGHFVLSFKIPTIYTLSTSTNDK